jgi:hypothetical protein
MNNTELQKLFENIVKVTDNIFDAYIYLKDRNDDYKKTDFYRITKKSIYEAFELYMRTIGGIKYTINLFKNIDNKELLNIIDVLSEEFNLENQINQMTPENKELFKQMYPYISK